MATPQPYMVYSQIDYDLAETLKILSLCFIA
jgi:hypothetical protein